MLLGIDHVIVAVQDVDSAAGELEAMTGLRVADGGRHDAHGTFNRLVWLGDSYIELMGVFDERLAGASWWGRHALTVIRAGGGPMGLALASDDLANDAARLRAAGSVLGEPEAGQRLRPDGRVVRWLLADAERPDPELGLAFLIEHDTTAAEWTADERAARAVEAHPIGGPVRLARLELSVTDMRSATMRLHRDLGVAFRPSLVGEGVRDGAVGRQTIRLLRGRVEPRIVLAGGDAAFERLLLGCRWLIEPTAPTTG